MKIAIICQADQQEGARAWHALLYAKELSERHHEVRLIFDGAGTTWVREWEKPGARHADTYQEVKKRGIITAICDFCAGAFKVHEETVKSGLPHGKDYDGHPSVAALVEEGFSLMVI